MRSTLLGALEKLDMVKKVLNKHNTMNHYSDTIVIKKITWMLQVDCIVQLYEQVASCLAYLANVTVVVVLRSKDS